MVTPAYFDTSVLVKNYVQELLSALMGRKSRQELRMDAIPGILARVRHDRVYWQLVDVGAPVLSQAEEIVQTVQMRALDAIHIASLLTFQVASEIRVPFITADSRQRDAAEQMKLDVVWVS